MGIPALPLIAAGTIILFLPSIVEFDLEQKHALNITKQESTLKLTKNQDSTVSAVQGIGSIILGLGITVLIKKIVDRHRSGFSFTWAWFFKVLKGEY